jgi:hypothetical protein
MIEFFRRLSNFRQTVKQRFATQAGTDFDAGEIVLHRLSPV